MPKSHFSKNDAVSGLSPARRVVLSAIALMLVCGNAVVALQPPQWVGSGTYLPHPDFVRDAFMITSMFSMYSPKNEDYVISGMRTQTGAAQDRGQWIRLPLQQHFPRRHELTTMQLYVPHHSSALGVEAGQRAWGVLARKIRANHNRLNPMRPVSLVRVTIISWPKDPRGFRANKVQGQAESRMWFSEALR